MKEFRFKGKVISEPIDQNNVTWLLEDSFGVHHNAADLLEGIDTILKDFYTNVGDEVEVIVRRKVE